MFLCSFLCLCVLFLLPFVKIVGLQKLTLYKRIVRLESEVFFLILVINYEYMIRNIIFAKKYICKSNNFTRYTNTENVWVG